MKFLLGIKFQEFGVKKKFVFEKQDSLYYPKYSSSETSNYIYFNRSLKFIELQTKDKLKLEGKGEFIVTEKEESLLVKQTKLSEEDFESYKMPKFSPIIELKKYDATIWEGYQILEPMKEMKNFEVSSEEN